MNVNWGQLRRNTTETSSSGNAQSPNSSHTHKPHMLAVSGNTGHDLNMTNTYRHNHAGSLGNSFLLTCVSDV